MYDSDRSRFTALAEKAEPIAEAVTECPFCRSRQVTQSGKAATTATYWRCIDCGELWNPVRDAAGRQRRGRWS
jgi:formate dehydrogenase maturation protein FdhE